LAVLDELAQDFQVRLVLLAHDHGESLTDEQRKDDRPNLPIDASGHVPAFLSPDDHEGAGRSERPPQL
jgi:hypothetical protein